MAARVQIPASPLKPAICKGLRVFLCPCIVPGNTALYHSITRCVTRFWFVATATKCQKSRTPLLGSGPKKWKKPRISPGQVVILPLLQIKPDHSYSRSRCQTCFALFCLHCRTQGRNQSASFQFHPWLLNRLPDML